jgi:DNA-directed RNA polymerase
LEDEAATGIDWLLVNNPEVFTSRELAKKAVMVTPYAGKFITQFDEVKTILRKLGIKDLMPDELFMPTVVAISKAIWDAIPEEIPGAIRGMSFMQSLITDVVKSETAMLPVIDKDGRPTGDEKLQAKGRQMMWTNSQGFPVYCDFRKRESKSAGGVDYKGNKVVVEYYSKTNIADVAKFKSSISANYIHSQDCSVLSKIVNSCDFELSCIHDSFACHVSQGPAMEAIIRESYIENFADGERVLLKFKDELIDCAPEGFTTDLVVPWIGDLDIEGVRNATYICH